MPYKNKADAADARKRRYRERYGILDRIDRLLIAQWNRDNPKELYPGPALRSTNEISREKQDRIIAVFHSQPLAFWPPVWSRSRAGRPSATACPAASRS